ncbi:MAG: mechanosensitive ion channel family protein [Gammaproteobacteria bacterium]|nr:mechanosensitive ion channel family protein [Gammaproteobacteria bacterium]NNL45273.1 mechanosensitive ion channel [Woeseiaceae bacterium]
MEEVIKDWLFDPVVGKLIAAVLLVAVVFTIVRYSQRVLGRHVEDAQRRYRLRKLITFFGYVLAILLLSIVYSDKLSGLTVLLGVLGAGVAFALQEIVVSVAGWISLSVGRMYDVGDRVQLSGIKGDVIDIGVLRTTLMECGGWIAGDQYSGRIVRIGNSSIFKEPVFNYSSDFPFLWDEITVPIRFGSDYEAARASFLQVLKDLTGEHASRLEGDWRRMTDKYLIENAQLQPMVTLKITDNWVEFVLRYVVDYKKRRSTKDRISSRILEVIESSGGKIVLGAPAFELASIPPLEVEVQNAK